MKIGDKVSFLSETGGGIVAGFQGKNIVLVEDKDGFQIPTTISEVVFVGTNDYNIAKVVSKTNNNSHSPNAKLVEMQSESGDGIKEDIVDREIKFKKATEERKGGNALACYLAFLPTHIKEMTSTRFEIYLINDCNYNIQYSFMRAEGNAWALHSQGEIPPNTSLYLSEIGREELNSLQKIGFQLFAYKRDKTFILKPMIEVILKLDPIKFYKLHSYKETIYFDTPALLYTIVENDRISRPFQFNASELKMSMYNHPDNSNEQSGKQIKTNSKSVSQSNTHGEIVVDLHIDKLLDNTIGMSHADILNYQMEKFKESLEKYRGEKGAKIIFIHGKGDGVLRHSIINILNYQYKKYQYQDASFQEYGYGATQVTIR